MGFEMKWSKSWSAALLLVGIGACANVEQDDAMTEPGVQASEPAAQVGGASCDARDKPTNLPLSAIKRYQSTGIAPAKGPQKPVIETHAGLADYTVYRPENLGDEPRGVLIWGNGGCSRDGTYFSKFLLEVASHGFIAIADGRPNGTGTRGIAPDGTPLVKALDWLLKENERPCSTLYKKIDPAKLAVAGQSCGGLMTLGASKDPRWKTAIIFNSGLFQRDQAIYRGLHTPIAYFIGGSSDIAFPQAEADVKAITTVPLFYGNLDVGHFATWAQDNAGEFGRVGINWLKWQLNADPEAEKEFAGPDCALCKSPSKWKVQKKNGMQ